MHARVTSCRMDWLAELNYGDVPTWVAAVAAAGALIAAFRAARHTRELLEREAKRDSLAEARMWRAQAEVVAAWVAVREWHETRTRAVPEPFRLGTKWNPFGIERRVETVERHELVVCVRNASAIPVYGVVVNLTHRGQEVAAPIDLGTVAPGDEARQSPLPPDAQGLCAEQGVASYELEAAVAFTDARGVPWCRDHAGALSYTGHA